MTNISSLTSGRAYDVELNQVPSRHLPHGKLLDDLIETSEIRFRLVDDRSGEFHTFVVERLDLGPNGNGRPTMSIRGRFEDWPDVSGKLIIGFESGGSATLLVD